MRASIPRRHAEERQAAILAMLRRSAEPLPTDVICERLRTGSTKQQVKSALQLLRQRGAVVLVAHRAGGRRCGAYAVAP